jgi:hypothetical protein
MHVYDRSPCGSYWAMLKIGHQKPKKSSILVFSAFKYSIKQTRHTAKIVSDKFLGGGGNKKQNLM